MITYVEKGIGLHETIAAAGHWLSNIDGVWISSDDVAVQAIIDIYDPLPKAKADAIAAINNAAFATRAKYVTVGTAQDDTYKLKLQQANDYLLNPVNIGALLSGEAAGTGITVDVLAAIIVASAAAYDSKLTQIEIARSSGKTAINLESDWRLIASKTAQAIANIEVI